MIVQIENDDIPVYLRFLEDVFPYMENYHYYLGMELVLDTLSALMKDVAVLYLIEHCCSVIRQPMRRKQIKQSRCRKTLLL